MIIVSRTSRTRLEVILLVGVKVAVTHSVVLCEGHIGCIASINPVCITAPTGRLFVDSSSSLTRGIGNFAVSNFREV